MANVFIEESTLTAIGDAIRAKTGATDKIYPADMAPAIEGITGGGEGVPDGYVTVTFHYTDQEGQKEFSRLVMVGDNCPDPWVQERIDTPTKESTAQYDYTFNGWATADGGTADNAALQNITGDKVLYAAFTESVRMYTIRFYDGDTLKAEKQFAYGETPGYEITKDGYSFDGWTPTPVPVTGDASYYATWSQNLSFAGSSWGDISDACEAGEASLHFAVGDTRTITAGEYTYVLRVVGIDLDEKADGSGKAGLTVMVDGPATDNLQMAFASTTGSNSAWGKTNCTIRTWLQTTFFNLLSEDLRGVIKTVTKTTKYAYEGNKTLDTQDTVFLPSMVEVGGSTSDEGTGIKYPYFSTNALRIFYDTNDTAVFWWVRVLNNNSAYTIPKAGWVTGTGIQSQTVTRAEYTDTTGFTSRYFARPFFCI